jgi:hypothetical protein
MSSRWWRTSCSVLAAPQGSVHALRAEPSSVRVKLVTSDASQQFVKTDPPKPESTDKWAVCRVSKSGKCPLSWDD